jgi:poly-gamma-glutamate synthesis protein (capsule biosynthesis protein)
VTIAFGGDVHFEGVLGQRLAHDPATALGPVSTLLSGADLSMTNFESALTNGSCPDPQAKQYVFHAPPSAITALKAAGITVVTEANNHGEDCGAAGLAQSLAIAHSTGFPVIGIGANATQAFAPYRATIHGQRIAIIAATQVLDTDLATAWTATKTQPGLASAYQEGELIAAVEGARKTSDTVIVYLHWGTETETCPNALQEPLAQALVQAGADIVVGAHAHVQLGAGYLGSALVDYGLGNLAFYDTTAPEDYSGSLVVTVTGRHIDSFNWRPAVLESGLPQAQTGAAATAAISRWDGLRSCTDLAGRPGRSTASSSSEVAPFTSATSTTLAD